MTTPIPPSLVLNSAGEKRQVPLRDYLNSRIAPFLKKAMTQSLESEAEFPLQWLGECLIHQSILYEGNPDSTNIKERFRYNFDVPPPPPPAAEQPAPTEVNGNAENEAEAAGTDDAASGQALTTEQQTTNGEELVDSGTGQQAGTGLAETPAQDTEMGGTS